MIPDTADFRAALAAVRVAYAFPGLSPVTGDLLQCEPVGYIGSRIGLTCETKISMSALLRRIQECLEKGGHVACARESAIGPQLAKLILTAAALLEPEGVQAKLAQLVESISTTDVELFAISDTEVDGMEACRVGDFLYGPLNYERIEHLDELMKSQGLKDHSLFRFSVETVHSKHLTLSRKVDGVKTLGSAIASSISKLDSTKSLLLGNVLSSYHECIAQLLWDDFRPDLTSQQAVAAACGVRSIPLHPFIGEDFVAELVTAFSNVRESFAFVKSHKDRSSGDTLPRPKELAEDWETVIQLLGLDDFGKRHNLDADIGRYCRYIQKAERYKLDGDLDQVRLHYVFALDGLLGGESGDPLTNTVSERVATLAETAAGIAFNEIRDEVKAAYDKRSGYAHRGENTTKATEVEWRSVKSLGDIGRIVLAAACWARKQIWCDKKASWLNRIDVIRAKRRVDGASINEECRELGLDRIHRPDKATCFAVRWPDVTSERT